MSLDRHQQSRTADSGTETGLMALNDLAALRFVGGEVARFLQGYLTTDAAHLGNEPQFTAMCNIKGRVVCTGCAWLDDGGVMLVLSRSLSPVVLDFLHPYLAFSKTSAEEVPSKVLGILGTGPIPREVDSLPGGRLDEDRCLFVAPAGTPDGQFGLPIAHGQRWDQVLVQRQEVWLESSTAGRFLPQMLGLVERGAVSFSKGCYLGQEVVARAQHRGEVKRKLALLHWQGDTPVVGAAIADNGREVGAVLLSSPSSAAAGQALAVLVRDQPGPFSSPQTNTTFHLSGE